MGDLNAADERHPIGRSVTALLLAAHLALFIADVVIADAGWRLRADPPPSPAWPRPGPAAAVLEDSTAQLALRAATGGLVVLVVSALASTRRPGITSVGPAVLGLSQFAVVIGRVAWLRDNQPADASTYGLSVLPSAIALLGAVAVLTAPLGRGGTTSHRRSRARLSRRSLPSGVR